jgi:hypothetical protein
MLRECTASTTPLPLGKKIRRAGVCVNRSGPHACLEHATFCSQGIANQQANATSKFESHGESRRFVMPTNGKVGRVAVRRRQTEPVTGVGRSSNHHATNSDCTSAKCVDLRYADARPKPSAVSCRDRYASCSAQNNAIRGRFRLALKLLFNPCLWPAAAPTIKG